MTDNDPPAIGARLAYGYGVCSAITMVERELTVLGRTVTASGAMLETMTHLGERLSPFDINAAPISASTDAGHPHDGRAEQWGFTPERPQTSATDWPSAHEIPKPQVRSDQAQPPRTWTIPRPDGSLIRPRHVAGQNATTTPRKAPQLTTSTASLVPSAVAVPATPASVNPLTSVAPPNLASSPSFVTSNGASTQSLALQVSAEPVAAAPETTSDAIEAPQESMRLRQIVIGAVAPGRTSQSTQRMFATQTVVRAAGVLPNTTEPLDATPHMAAQPEVPLSRTAPAELPGESEPRQGTIILDGTQLGQWVIDHLERYASRPGAMTTGIDPRMSAAYPGASSGS